MATFRKTSCVAWLAAVAVMLDVAVGFGPSARCGAGSANTCVRGNAANWTTVASAAECCEVSIVGHSYTLHISRLSLTQGNVRRVDGVAVVSITC